MLLVPQSLASLQAPCAHAATEIRAQKVYIATEKDLAAPYEAQIMGGNMLGAKVVPIGSGHEPVC